MSRIVYDEDYAAPSSARRNREELRDGTAAGPRAQPGYRPRGAGVFTYDRERVAKEAKVKVSAVRKAEQRGQLDMGDLRSVARWIERRGGDR